MQKFKSVQLIIFTVNITNYAQINYQYQRVATD